MEQNAFIEYPVAPVIGNRKSVRAFSSAPVEAEKIKSLFEATRWAPSSTNEQPWIYIYATKGDPLWEKLLSALNESNQVWAREAPLLIASAVRTTFTRNNLENAYALYDLGAANAFLSLQAVELGLQVRQMGGFDAAKATQELQLPASYVPGVFIAAGYPGSPDQLPEKLKAREEAPRMRKPQEEFVFNSVWND